MGDLDENMDEQSVITAFAQFGEAVVAVKIVKNKNKQISLNKFYSFIEFADVDTAQRVLHKLNGKYIPGHSGKRFKLNPASYGRDHELLPEFSLHVGDLSWEIDDYELFSFFQKRYKSTRSAKIVQDSTGKSKGYGFIRFSEENDQQRALIEMQHMTGLGRRPIKVSLASVKRPNDISHLSQQTASNCPSSYYAGHYSWGGYSFHYNQGYNSQSLPCPDYTTGGYQEAGQRNVPVDDDSEILEDPGLEINVGKENKEFIECSESFFQALERSRWQPLDSVMSAIPD